MAQIGWIDFSKTHKDRVATVLDLLKPEGMVDELGIGIIRDAMANNMFPGISTIQTRAKYFFLTPYIFWDYCKLSPAKKRNKSIQKYLDDWENQTMWQLIDLYEGKEGEGVIGITKKRPQTLMRKPSAIYWNGMTYYKFINTDLALTPYLKIKSNNSLESLLADSLEGDDISNDDKDADYENVFCLRVMPENGWFEKLNDTKLELTHEEADFFQARIKAQAKGMLIAVLSDNPALYSVFIESNGFADFAKMAQKEDIDNKSKSILALAHDFSEMMYGAHILYNVMLQNKFFGNNCYNEEWNSWYNNIESALINSDQLTVENIFSYALNVKSATYNFVLEWIREIKSGKADFERLKELVLIQETENKKHKARLRKAEVQDVFEEKWIGLTLLEYRFSQAKRILSDIKNGLNS